jgi:methionine synthase II (cobalamin-independent)
MSSTFQASSLPVLIGSIPMRDHAEATETVLRYTPQLPLWAQLPAYPEEGMVPQFLPGLPGYVQQGDDYYVDTRSEDYEADLVAFYEEYMQAAESGRPLEETRFKLGSDRARGFYVLLERLQGQSGDIRGVKGQITGPVTFATGVKDQEKKPIFYDHQLRDAANKLLGLKARWQAERLSEIHPSVIVFFDEPALAGFGSSEFISISKQDVLECFSEVVAPVHQAGGLTGIHVCANADWSLVLDSEADILSFDAYSYFDKLLIYSGELNGFLEAGKIIAWGIVPTLNTEDIERETADSLYAQFREKLARLRDKTGRGERQLLNQSLITPSCGTGSLNLEQATKVMRMTRDVSERIRRELLQ